MPASTKATSHKPIAFCLPALAGGGMEQVTLTLINAFIEQRHDVDLVLERRQGDYLDRVPATCGLVTLDKRDKWQALLGLIRRRPVDGARQAGSMLCPGAAHLPLGRLNALVAYLARRRPKVFVVAHGRMPLLALWARDIARVPTRVIVVEHSTLSRWLSVFADEPAKRRRWAHRVAWARRLYPRADAIVAVSNGVADDLAQTLGLARTRITTIYNPVDTAALRQRAAEPVEHPWFAATEPPVILAVGRLVREKNFGALIEAFAALLQRHDSDARLVIVGEGEERGALQARIGVLGLTDRIHLAGWRDNPYALMSASAMLVVGSLFEGLGMVLIEAMACSCAVVSVDCPSGPAEILADGCYGQLVPMHDINTLAEAMHQTLTTPPDKPVLIERAEAFSVAAAYAGYNRLIAEVTTGVYN